MGYIKTKTGAQIYLYRANTQNAHLSSTEYLPESQFSIGMNEITPLITATSLTQNIPIADGTVNDDGSNTLTGSAGGEDSTANTIIFKPGANQSDNTAQNLITNTSSLTKTWTISNLATAGVICNASNFVGLWLYIKDAATLDKFEQTGTCIQVRIGAAVGGSDYYYKDWTISKLTTGWNWLCENELLSSWDVSGTPGVLSQFQINIYTIDAASTFVAGDVIYDLLRSWAVADMYKDYTTNYPSINLTNLEVTKQGYLTSLEAVGYNITGYGDYNKDSSIKLGSKAKLRTRSKADTDEFIFINKDRIIL
jgi:hypothetical protein